MKPDRIPSTEAVNPGQQVPENSETVKCKQRCMDKINEAIHSDQRFATKN